MTWIKMRLSVHDRLNFIRFNGDFGHQVDGALLGDNDVILQTHTKTLLWKINPRLHGEDCAGLKRHIVVTHIVHIEAKWMAKAMHEIFAAGGVVRVLLLDLTLF
jgi:hypothetical protein